MAESGNLTHDTTTNHPPAEIPKDETLEQRLRRENADLFARTTKWLDGAKKAPAAVADDAANAAFGKTVQKLQEIIADAKAKHTTEKKPFLDGGRTVDNTFLAAIVKPAEDAKAVLVKAQSAYLTKKRREEEEKARLAAEAAREEQERLEREAQRLQDQGRTDEAMAVIDEAVVQAETAQEQETRAEAKPAELVRQHSNLGVTVSGRDNWETTYIGPRDKIDWAAIGPYLSDDHILRAAKAAVKAGRREIAGFRIENNVKALNR